jgi:hypothetical protein
MVGVRRRGRGCGAVILHHPPRCQRGMKTQFLLRQGWRLPSPGGAARRHCRRRSPPAATGSGSGSLQRSSTFRRQARGHGRNPPPRQGLWRGHPPPSPTLSKRDEEKVTAPTRMACTTRCSPPGKAAARSPPAATGSGAGSLWTSIRQPIVAKLAAMVGVRRRGRGRGAVILHHPRRCQRGVKKRLLLLAYTPRRHAGPSPVTIVSSRPAAASPPRPVCHAIGR